ncbi:MAG: hypothetical protein KF747_03500 [Nitrospira sp.]|nr:hypothetical protein [Nitrospira sp.]
MKPLTPAHKELLKLLAAEAVDAYIAENNSMDKRIRIPIDQFTYDPITRKFFRYGQEWKAAGVNAVVERVEGMKATEWLKLQAVGR